MSIIVLILAVACFGSFSWAILRIFLPARPMPAPMRWLGVLDSLGALLHFVVLVTAPEDGALPMTGAAMYLAALALFWWAVPHARRAELGIAFAGLAPRHIVETGPYAWIRHPFYTAYLLFWAAGVIASGQVWLASTLLIFAAFYYAAIRQEEAELAATPLGATYARYRQQTGMLLPRLRRMPP